MDLHALPLPSRSLPPLPPNTPRASGEEALLVSSCVDKLAADKVPATACVSTGIFNLARDIGQHSSDDKHTDINDKDNKDNDQDEDMWGLMYQPLEVLHEIFSGVDLPDILSLMKTCRHFRDSIGKDDLLWRVQYLTKFDEPIQTPKSWKAALRRLLEMQQLLRGGNRLEKEDNLEEVANTALELLTAAKEPCPEKNQRYLAALMATRSNRSCFLSRSSLFRRAGLPLDEPAATEELRQLSAKLHVYYGMEIELNELDLEQIGAQEIHPCARSRVYDLRRYHTKNSWGPFMDDGSGRVDWEKAQAIVIVLAHGLRIFSQRINGIVGPFWDRPFHGCAANSYQSFSLGSRVRTDEDTFDGLDPYGVRGTWIRVVNFLDFHDLFAYNFQPPFVSPDQERAPISTKEAIRLILLRLKVTKIAEAEEDDDSSMPRVYFEGTSNSLTNNWDPNANSKIRGHVRKTKHGDIHWTTFSIFGNQEHWRSESIQIGGPRSARGTVGNWFEKNYDRHGPAGPTAFWKVSDDIIDTERRGRRSASIPSDHIVNDNDSEDDDDYEDVDDGEETEETEEAEENVEGESGTDLDAEEQEAYDMASNVEAPTSTGGDSLSTQVHLFSAHE